MLEGSTKSSFIRAEAHQYEVPGRGRVESLPNRIYLEKTQIVSGTSVLGRMRHPRAQWMLKFVAKDHPGEGGVRLEALASTLASRQQAMESKLSNGGVLFLFALPVTRFANASASAGASGSAGAGASSHFLFGVMHPPTAARLKAPRPDVKVWRGTVVLHGFGIDSEEETLFSVSAYRQSTRKQPTRTVASHWPSFFKLDKSALKESSSFEGINSPRAQWFVRIVPLGAQEEIWNVAATHIQVNDLAVEIPTASSLGYSLYITTQDTHGRGLEIIGVFGPKSSQSSSAGPSSASTSRPRNRIGVHHL